MRGTVAPIEVDVLAAVRTPVGRYGGALSSVRVDDLGALVIAEALSRSAVAGEEVDEVFAGVVNASGEAMGNLARFSARLAGLPASVPALTMNRYCGSGLSAVGTAAHSIAVGAADVAIAVGAESMSRSTWPLPKLPKTAVGAPMVARDATFSGAGGPQHPALEMSGEMIDMPVTAQNLVEKFGLDRQALDGWALRSHTRAAEAAAAGHFVEETVPVEIADGTSFASDETIRPDTSLERLAALDPYHPDAPDITAGNASPINDGASALVLCHPDVSLRRGEAPLARITGVATAGVEPALMGLGAAAAARRLPRQASSVDAVEVNEAFAAVALACIEQLELDEERVNRTGGAIALGHALGNSGTRLVTTLIHALRRQALRSGIATMCIGGGQGIAIEVEIPA